MKKIAYVLFGLAVLLSDVMCFVTAYMYREMLCGIRHMGYSAPPGVAFLYAIPFLIVIVVCTAVGIVLLRKAKK